MNCRYCKQHLIHTFLDLGYAPPSNSYLSQAQLGLPELYFPLRVKVCDNCWLVQTEDYADAEQLFSPIYAYFSSTSSSWLEHSKNYAERMIRELNLSDKSYVIEVASNDGYLLKNFVDADIPCLGIEPTDSTANAAEKLTIPVLREFFSKNLAKKLVDENKQADLVVGNNVYAHVPDIKDFTDGLKLVLKHNGTITLEFPHLMSLIDSLQFDTVYHEHFSYLSLHVVCDIFASSDLRIWKVEELKTHGGSLRVFGCHADDDRDNDKSVLSILQKEKLRGLLDLSTYLGFQNKISKIKNDFLQFLISKKDENKLVVAYGAAAKGNTLLNFAGVKPDLLPYVFDAATVKQGQYLPGSHIPIFSPEKLEEVCPDYVIILPWNIAEEIQEQLTVNSKCLYEFVTFIPTMKIF